MIQYKFLFLLFFGLILCGCGLKRPPIETISEVKEDFQTKITDTIKMTYPSKLYKSLAYGELKVYKPDAFLKLDSIYRIKQQYLERNDFSGLHKSNIEELIPGYRAAAQKEINEVKYEIEHVFQIRTPGEDSVTIHHNFYVFNYQDSLMMVTPFYQFRIPLKTERFLNAYIYRQHFLTDRNLYISEREVNFINYMDQHKTTLIGSPQLQPFMNHVFMLMDFSNIAHSVDFNDLSKYMAIHYFKTNAFTPVIQDLGKLYVYKDKDEIVNYELKVKWKDKKDQLIKQTIFTFSPYLQIEKVKTKVF